MMTPKYQDVVVMVDYDTAELIRKMQHSIKNAEHIVVINGSSQCFKAAVAAAIADLPLIEPTIRLSQLTPTAGKQKAQWKTERNHYKP